MADTVTTEWDRPGPLATGAISEAERRLRVDLAAAYRLAHLHGWTDVIYTHISVRLHGPEPHFLINPFGLGFDEITASSLIRIDGEGRKLSDSPYPVNGAGFVIHSAVHMARPDAHCVMHLHNDAGMALAMCGEGLLPLSQHAMMFYDRIGYHEYEGLALRLDERERLVRDLGPHQAMILRNHGLLTTGASVAAAYMRMNYLDKSARTQLAAMAATRDLRLPPPEIAERTAAQHDRGGRLGEREWPALLRRLDRIDPSFRD